MIKERRRRRVVNIENNKNLKQINKKNKPAPSANNGFYYSFLTVILLLCLVQITFSAVLNVSKIISYKAKIVQITKTRDAAVALNEQLQDNIKNFSKVDGLEAIARNNLKMSGEDEVLVIINTPKVEEQEDNTNKEHKFQFFKHKNKELN